MATKRAAIKKGSAQRVPTKRLSRDDWISGALTMVGELGLERLAVEPLAVRLGTTKGSFYWHFSDRNDLLTAALEHWAQRATQAVIAEVDREPDPERLAALISGVGQSRDNNLIELAILAAADDPRVHPIVSQVHQTRLEYLTERLTGMGLPTEQARTRASICYSAYVGGLLLEGRRSKGSWDNEAHSSELLRMLTSKN